jgi:hypothetical protein
MKKLALAFILILILTTSLVKNSTKEIEDKTFNINETIKSLEVELGDIMLEYNYLSSPEQLIKHQAQYFENNLIKIDVTKIKKITINNSLLEVSDFIDKLQTNE